MYISRVFSVTRLALAKIQKGQPKRVGLRTVTIVLAIGDSFIPIRPLRIVFACAPMFGMWNDDWDLLGRCA